MHVCAELRHQQHEAEHFTGIIKAEHFITVWYRIYISTLRLASKTAEACTFGALVNQTRRSYTDLTYPFGILEAYTNE